VAKVAQGFKARAERMAAEQRALLGLDPHAPLAVPELAARHRALIKTPEQEPGLRTESLQALSEFSDCWSAITVRTPDGAIIINNPLHNDGRQNSNVTHEIAHLVLRHAPGALQTISGCVLRDFDEIQEAEAALLGETLLAPRVSLEWAARRRMNLPMTARWLGASDELVRYRANLTGVRRQFRGCLAG
jgi:hypothetical protein